MTPPATGDPGFRLPWSWIATAYVAIFVGLASLVNVTWPRLSPVQDAYQLDGRTQRLVLTHQDTFESRLYMHHLHDGIHLEGSALRGVQLTDLMLRLERDCPLDVPHRHPASLETEDFVIAFAGKTAHAGAKVRVSLGMGKLGGDHFAYQRVVEVPLTDDWKEFRSKVDFWRPTRPRSGITPFQTLLLEFSPANVIDLAIRDVRLLAVPKE